MGKRHQISELTRRRCSLTAIVLSIVGSVVRQAELPKPAGPQSPSAQTTPQDQFRAQAAQKPKDGPAKGTETHITPDEAKQLFGSG